MKAGAIEENLVFISHSYKDMVVANAVKEHLESLGILCWKAPESIPPGEEWAEVIARVIPQSKAMVLLWTNESMNSRQVLNELTLADRSGVVVIPFRLEAIEPEGAFRYYLYKTHWLEANGSAWRSRLQFLGEQVLRHLSDSSSPSALLARRNGLWSGKASAVLAFSILATIGVAGFFLNRKLFVLRHSEDIQQAQAATRAVDDAVSTLQLLYSRFSSGNFQKGLQLVRGDVQWQYSEKFFRQFDRVTIQDIHVKGRTGSTLNMEGTITFVWPNGSMQKELRSFSVDTAARPPQVTSTEFIRVVQPR